MKLDYHVILDLQSGTFFGANNAYIIDTRNIPDLEAFNEGTDSDRREIAEQFGTDLENWTPPTEAQALDAIANLLSGVEWNVDTLMAISDLVTATGRTVEDV